MLGKKIILVGYSGHATALADVALNNKLNIIGYTESSLKNNNPYGFSYLGDENNDDFFGWSENEIAFLIGIGANVIREKIFRLILSKKKEVLKLISTNALVSNSSLIGQGTFVNNNVTVNALSKIGDNVILNTGCIVEHECIINDSAHIAPGAVLAGNVTIGTRSFIGSNAVIKNGLTIGKDVVVGAGCVVLNDVGDGEIIVGNPGKII